MWRENIDIKSCQSFIARLVNQHRSKSSALFSVKRDQISRGANLFLGIALKELYIAIDFIQTKRHIFLFKVDI